MDLSPIFYDIEESSIVFPIDGNCILNRACAVYHRKSRYRYICIMFWYMIVLM